MSTEFSFGQVEAVCAALNRIADDKRVAFGGRLKQLQKQGLRESSVRPGRGKAGTYSFGDMMRYVVALELVQAGIMPQMAAKLVNGSWDLLRINIYSCSFAPEETIGFNRKPTEYLWMISPEALRGLTRDGENEWDHIDRIRAVPIQDAAKELAHGVNTDPEHFGEGSRTLVLNGYNLTQRVMRTVSFFFRYASRAELRADLEDEIEAWDDEARKFGEELRSLPELTPEQSEAVRRRIAAMQQMDWTTNPPTPRHLLVERADELIQFLPAHLREFLTGPEPEQFTLDDDSKRLIGELIDLNILTLEMIETEDLPDIPDKMSGGGRVEMSVTPFGMVVFERLGGPWAEALAAKFDQGEADGDD